jgi:hypothetical protein
MPDKLQSRERSGEVFWRKHHEAWQQSTLISASSCAIVSGRGRRNAIRRAIASCAVRLTEMFAGGPEVA